MSFEIKHDRDKGQFTADVAGGQALLHYRLTTNGKMDIFSTYVPAEARGMKVAELLLQAALAFAHREKMKIIPTCSYVAVWFKRHPEQQQFLEEQSR
jgi:predicted GNAT family acetyltransferase